MIEYTFYFVGKLLSVFMPLSGSYFIAKTLSRLKYYFSKTDRETVFFNLGVILKKEKSELKKICKSVFENFGFYLVDFLRFEKLDAKFFKNNVELIGLENVEQASEHGKGVILLTAHIGNWELGGVYLAHLGYPVCAVALTHKNKKVNDLFVNQREVKGLEVVSLENCMPKAIRWLKSKKFFAIVGDRSFSADEVEANFFSRPAFFPKGPSVLALRTMAPIVPGFLVRDGRYKYKLIFEKPIYSTKTDNMQEDVRRTTQMYVNIIEKYVLLYPQQWFVFEKFWRT